MNRTKLTLLALLAGLTTTDLVAEPAKPPITTVGVKALAAAPKSTAQSFNGFATLRSATPDRAPNEQIQAVLKGGTTGGSQPHFDATSLDNITRYGRSFWGLDAFSWGISNEPYKLIGQASVNRNMVVVDRKQQESVLSSSLLAYSGKMLQAAAVETNARWSVLAPETKGPSSERILQRRLLIVTDDYVLVADYLKGSQSHTFDNVFQFRDFGGIDGAEKKLVWHDEQHSTDLHSAAQFITDCDWYTATAPAVGHFAFSFGPVDGNRKTRPTDINEPGTVKMDIHSAWPPSQQIMLASIVVPRRDHPQRRKVYGIRSTGTEARFVTVLEPYQTTAVVKAVTAEAPDHIRVELADGRIQQIAISGLDGDGKHVGVDMVETKAGAAVRSESCGYPGELGRAVWGK
ncbi:MAG TPA: hypothetical protein VGK19_05695 [Capsulimonadaceae bacterium]